MICRIKRFKQSIAERKDYENTCASVENQMAYIDYIAMMCGVDIPTEEEGANDVSED